MQRYEAHPPDVWEDEAGSLVDYEEAQAELTRLTAERDQALTQVAAAYEAAAKLSEASAERNKTCPSGCRCADGWHIAMRIRNLTPDDAQAALDKLLSQAREYAQPAPVDRDALVRRLQIITRNGSLDDGRTLHEVIADAMLNDGG